MSDLAFIYITAVGPDQLCGLEANGRVWRLLVGGSGWVPLNMAPVDDATPTRVSPEAIVAKADVQEGKH